VDDTGSPDRKHGRTLRDGFAPFRNEAVEGANDSPCAAVAATSRHTLRRSPPAPSRLHRSYARTLAREVPDGPQWAHEIKHDGLKFRTVKELSYLTAS
jgi:hypothetical protein